MAANGDLAQKTPTSFVIKVCTGEHALVMALDRREFMAELPDSSDACIADAAEAAGESSNLKIISNGVFLWHFQNSETGKLPESYEEVSFHVCF